jgi:flagellar protein FliS
MSLSTSTYRNVDLGTASPRQLLLRVYDSGIANLAEAEAAFHAGAPAGENLDRVRSVVAALMSALDFETGEIAHNLLRLYLFVLDRVYESQIQKKDRSLREARRVLETLRDAWRQVPAEQAREAADGARAAALDLKG